MKGVDASRVNGGNPTAKRAESDFYPTPPDVTFALIDRLKIDRTLTIWEPACGENDMVNEMRECGYNVLSTDIKEGTDFLKQTECPCDWIITNPPFSLAEEFIRKCASFNVPFALLLKTQFWHAAKRKALWAECKPAQIMPLTWRADFLFKSPKSGSPLMEVCWNLWLPYYTGDTFYVPLDKPVRSAKKEES